MKKFLLAVLVVAMFPSFSMAQSTNTSDVDPAGTSISSCVTLTVNMRYRMRDVQTNGGVSALQDFLNTKGYLSSEPTGFFGIATLKAVKDYQSSIGLSPTGYVGPLTRAKINASCGGGETTTTTTSSGNFPAGCTSASGYSVMTGRSCSPSTSSTNNGTTSCVTVGNVTTCTTNTSGFPTIDLKVASSRVAIGQPVDLSWTSTNVSSCQAGSSGAYSGQFWSGSKVINGYDNPLMPSGNSVNYTLTCMNTNGTSATDSVTVYAKSVTPTITVSSPSQPSNAKAYDGATKLPFTKITLTSSADIITVNGITVQRTGAGDNGSFSSVALLDENGSQYGPSIAFNSNNQATIGGVFVLDPATTKTFTVVGNMAPSLAAYPGFTVNVIVVSVNTIATVNGYLPVLGANHITSPTSCVTTGGTTTCTTGPAPTPKVTLTINGNDVETSQLAGSSLSFIWTSNGVTNCIPQGSWEGAIGTSGSRTIVLSSTIVGQYAYFIRCTATNGNFVYSPAVSVNVSSVPSVPTVEILSTPTISIGYSATNGQEILVAKTTVKITAGSSDFKLYKYGAFDNTTDAFMATLNNTKGANGSQVNPIPYLLSGNATDNGTYWTITTGQTATFSLRNAGLSETKALFAGSYNATFSMYRPAGGSPAVSYIANGTTNSVTVVGETAPYLTGIVSSVGSATNSYTIKGIRLNASLLSVTINGKTLALPPASGTEIPFNPSDFGITSSGNYVIQVNHPTEGMSNKISTNISICTTTGTVTTCY